MLISVFTLFSNYHQFMPIYFKMVKKCCVKFCKSESYAGCGISFHSFPKDGEMKQKWIDVITTSQKITKNSVVCSRHFKKEDFYEANSRQLLKVDVIPFVFPSNTDQASRVENFSSSKFTQDGTEPSSSRTWKRRRTDDDDESTLSNVESLSGLSDAESPGPQFSWQQSTNLIEGDNSDGESESSDPQFSCEQSTRLTDGDHPDENKENEYVREKHEGFTCDHCLGEIIGFRYTCIQCDNYDLCGECESKLVHPLHYILRVSTPKPYHEIKRIIDAVRLKIIALEEAANHHGDNFDDVVIKKEEDPFERETNEPLELQPETNEDVTAGAEQPETSRISDREVPTNSMPKQFITETGSLQTNFGVNTRVLENQSMHRTQSKSNEDLEDSNISENIDFEEETWLDESLLESDEFDTSWVTPKDQGHIDLGDRITLTTSLRGVSRRKQLKTTGKKPVGRRKKKRN
ncbi:uncharacterized protein LOC106143476 isoform X2 [Amyelois transitella]|uniref:uncharacterized protein LOC106143476 isoform X2 n=1 Tax=Amyelois transitella TaxID=680683 RepID=UPI0029907D0E|nr:uncharacterized protein LOC106143476 isoform X2 [Amyelois transitella]